MKRRRSRDEEQSFGERLKGSMRDILILQSEVEERIKVLDEKERLREEAEVKMAVCAKGAKEKVCTSCTSLLVCRRN